METLLHILLLLFAIGAGCWIFVLVASGVMTVLALVVAGIERALSRFTGRD